MIGLALSYAIVLTGVIGNAVEVFTQQEMLMVAVERLEDYSTTPPVEEITQDTVHWRTERQVHIECYNYSSSFLLVTDSFNFHP